MPLQPGKLGAHVCPNQVQGQFRRHDPRSNADHVTIVILHALVRGEDFMTGRGTDSQKLIGRNANAGAAATQQDRSLDATLLKGLRHGSRVVRIVDGIGGIRPKIEHLIPGFGQFPDNSRFQRISAMVCGDGNLHD
jgi:hypothetical protein